MAVPEDIRKVKRPPNTIVQDSGRDGPKRYSVRERNGTRYIPGENPQPINGKTIGYIIDHQYVPICEKTAIGKPTMLSYGAAALIKALSEDILRDLLTAYPPNDAFSILALAALKVTKPGISGSRMQSAYERSFISIFWPDAALSRNSITALYRKVGADGKKREIFFEHRLAEVCKEDHILIDGTLKQNTSKVNDLSAFSYKARLKGCEDISLLYAYDLEKMEPICAQVFPGNSIDAVSYHSFIQDNKITSGIIVSDKGFPPNQIRDILLQQPCLHYLTPVKRNDKRINAFKMTEFEGVLAGVDKTVQYKKANVAPGIWLYAFRDSGKAAAEERSYLERVNKKDSYDDLQYNKKKRSFGLIVFESDKDMDARSAYLSYEERWKLELVFKAYKSDECLDCTSVHGDFSVYGSEFVNFISTLITCRIITKATKAGLLSEMTYADMIDDLNTAWRRTDTPMDSRPVTDDVYWVHTIPKVFGILERLDLSVPVKKEPQKRGPKPGKDKCKDLTDNSAANQPCNEEQDDHNKQAIENSLPIPRPAGRPGTKTVPDPNTPKRPVGRPRTRPLPDPNTPKRPVGRPRTKPVPDPNAPKRPVGRPRTRPLPDPNIPKRPVGRPKKNHSQESNDATSK